MPQATSAVDDPAELDAALRRLGLLDASASARWIPLQGGISSDIWPASNGNEAAVEALVSAIESAGPTPGRDMAFSLDVAAGDRVQVVGDDYLVTNAGRVEAAARDGACNAVLVKPNQAGTPTEARAALSVGWCALQLKVGSITRGERAAMWNEGLRIAEALGKGGPLPDPKLFPWGVAR